MALDFRIEGLHFFIFLFFVDPQGLPFSSVHFSLNQRLRLAPDFVLNKFYPKFNEQKLEAKNIQNLSFDPSKEVHIKVTRVTEYGERYKLFVIDKGKFENKYKN